MEQRYKRVRKQLDDLGYMQVLIPEALPLVEKLTADLIQTTTSLQKYKKIAKTALEEQDNLQLGAEPYKCDNAKLVRECNELHLAFIQFREQNEKTQKDLKRRLSDFEKQKLDFETQCEKLKKRIRDLEFESAKKTDRILGFQNKTHFGSKTTAKSSGTSVSKSRVSTATKSDREISTTMGIADQKIVSLSKEIQNLKEEHLQLSEMAETYKNQLSNRDREILRLNQMLEGGRPAQALNQDCCFKDTESKLYRLEKEVSSLEKDKFELETHLKESVAKQHEAMKRALNLAERNKQLENELREIDQMALAVEADCNCTIKKSADKVSMLEEKVQDKFSQVQSLEGELTELKCDKQELLSHVEVLKFEKTNLQKTLETALDEKKRLNDRINQCTCIENDLNLEIDRLVQTSAAQKRKIAELECRCLNEKLDGAASTNRSERNELLQKLQSSEMSIANLQHENKTLAQDKHNLMTRLESSRDRIEPDYDSFSLKASVRRLERERDILKADIIRLEEERDALRHNLKMVSEQQGSDTLRVEKALKETEEEVKRLEQERRELMNTQGVRRATISSLEDQCDTLKNQLQTCQMELSQQRLLYTQLKTLQEQTDKALGDSQGQLAQAEKELDNFQNRIANMDKERALNEEVVNALKSDITALKGNLSQMDAEKDALLIAVDNKTEKLALIEQDVREKDENLRSLSNSMTELQKKLSTTMDTTSARDQLLRTASVESASLRQELEAVNRSKESAIQENRRLQDDLAACAADCKCARTELNSSTKQIEDLKRQLQHYVAEVKRFEDLMSAKEYERTELLDQFRSLSQEAELLENNNHNLQSDATQSKVQLSVTLDHVSDLETKLSSQTCLVSAYEKRIADLTLQVANMQEQLCHCQKQQESTEAELRTVRQLSIKLDQQKDDLVQEIKEKDKQRSSAELDTLRLRRESEILHGSLTKDRKSVESLEQLLADARHEGVQLRLQNQELEAEIQKLNQKLQELQGKLINTAEQLDFYQERALDYSQQNKQLRREVANERFFRAKEEDGKRYPSL